MTKTNDVKPSSREAFAVFAAERNAAVMMRMLTTNPLYTRHESPTWRYHYEYQDKVFFKISDIGYSFTVYDIFLYQRQPDPHRRGKG